MQRECSIIEHFNTLSLLEGIIIIVKANDFTIDQARGEDTTGELRVKRRGTTTWGEESPRRQKCSKT
jgi:hypothetical protein